MSFPTLRKIVKNKKAWHFEKSSCCLFHFLPKPNTTSSKQSTVASPLADSSRWMSGRQEGPKEMVLGGFGSLVVQGFLCFWWVFLGLGFCLSGDVVCCHFFGHTILSHFKMCFSNPLMIHTYANKTCACTCTYLVSSAPTCEGLKLEA